MSLKRLLFRLLLWSVLSICQGNFFLSKYYYSPAYYCVTNTSFAMGWIKPKIQIKTIDSRLKTDATYIPESRKLTISYPWIPKNSINESFNHVILDDRWEEMPLVLTPGGYINMTGNLKGDFTVPLSISINSNAHIFLCDGLEPRYSNCYWFMLQFFDGKDTIIRKCGRNVIPSFIGDFIYDSCRKYKIYKKHKSNEIYLFNTKWSHFEIGKKGNHIFFNQFKNGVSTNIIEWFDDGKVINVHNLIVNADFSNGLWKIHQVNYMYVDKECSTNLGKFRKNKDNSVCVSMYIAMCANCKIKLTATGAHYNYEETYTFQKGWTQIKYIASNVGDGELTLTLSTIGNEENKFWAIDKLRTCHKEEYRKIESRGIYTDGQFKHGSRSCQLMSHDKNLVLFREAGVSNSKCPLDAIGDFCMPCDLLYKTGCVRLEVCTTKKCFCSGGYKAHDGCWQECISGSYGHGCRKRCEENCINCNHVDGTCEKCINDYKLPQCASVEITTTSYTEEKIKAYPEFKNEIESKGVKGVQKQSTLTVLEEIRDELKKLTQAVLQVANAIINKTNNKKLKK